jgi:hypothetical protein
MPHPSRINPLHTRPINRPRISTLRVIILHTRRLIVIVPEYTSPLLHRLLVVLRLKRGVHAAVVDLHPRARAVVAGVHVEDDLGPGGWGCLGLAVGAGAVPGVDGAGRGHEAAGVDARVDDAGFEDVGVCGGEDVLVFVSSVLRGGPLIQASLGLLTVIMAPLLLPVTKTLLASALYSFSVHLTMFAMVLLSPPPSWVRVCLLLTSQHVPEWGELG